MDSTVDQAETAKFAAMAEEWWDPDGKFAPLHKLNPVRLEFLRDRICTHFGRDPMATRPLDGLKLADIGCGGGLLRIAATHAETVGVGVDYRCDTVEAMAARGEAFDVVLNMEVVEHVADVELFLGASAALVNPGGIMFLATLNRTLKAFGLAIVGAEYIMGWLPRGTHDWNKFVRPSELAAPLRRAGLEMTEVTGVAFNPLKDRWSLAPKDLDVNYMAVAVRQE
jgi:2-polyprenyl-6-hydroxyphenyl methylase/3-demethylubiquinone-9 3-methyltransferase